MNQSLNSLNNSSFVQIEAGLNSALPATLFGLFGGSDASLQRQPKRNEPEVPVENAEDDPPETVRKSSD